ncbi:hypothetical protein FWP27_23140 [Vibrio parahaemolyticus]|nr:hypothetical protein [Vibrio parahaemolyticus]
MVPLPGSKANKQFKRDSQRLAFLVLLQIKCLWHNALGLGGSVAHPLIGRYVYLYFNGLKILRSLFFVPLAIRSSCLSKSALSA